MPRFLCEAAYKPEAWAAQLENPTNRLEQLKPCLDSVGARVETAYFAFGEYDMIVIIEAPDNISAAALSLCFAAGGALKAMRTTPLMTIQEGMDAMRKGARALAAYTPLTRQMAGTAKN
ncbi:MAG: GYD domain-containing protein [Candidatus Eremiobacteraeota bacterium]|nr:GYD domain-containing protein [Candidatus Eremiobacteraeota bacterium]